MKSILKHLFGLFVLFLFSCTQDELYQDSTFIGDEEITKITAVISAFDDVDTRTSFTTGEYPTNPNPVWAEGDSLGIYPDVGDQLSFRINTGGGSNCTFTGGGWALKSSSSYTAYYPFRRYNYLEDKTALPINMVGQTQNGNDNSDHWGAYDYQIAKGKKPESGSLIFEFERKVALVRMELKAPCAASWKSITLESTATFTTKAKMNLSLETPTITATAQSNSVTLNLKNVQTTADDLDIIAYMMLLPVDFTGKSLSVKLTDVDDNIYTAEATFVNNKTNYAANSARWIRADFEEGMAPTIPYVTFSADAQQQLKMSKAVDNLEYSVNGGEWKTLGTTIVTFGGDNGDLRLRGKNSNGTATNSSDYSYIRFGNETQVACTGDIRTLINYENYSNASGRRARFCRLFEDCYQLISAPSLPATELADHCYFYMFGGCTSLTSAPELPATALANDCYSYMFHNCTSLISAPTLLPATTLADYCYNYMFSDCTSLTEVPILPATTLADYCCSFMFSDCTSLTSAPALLPATTLADHCYRYMFSGCTSLTEAPELPATNLAESCYYSMFYGCTSLTEAPALPATWLERSCYSSMFKGCTSLTSAPVLPATTLADHCYRDMFLGCSSLTEAPELPATTLAESCYSDMFEGCTSLTEAPALPATNLAESCYYGMFTLCSSLVAAPELPATTLAYYCYNSMFAGCASLTIAPELPATTLTTGCYGGMFARCVKLATAPKLPATNLAINCYGEGMIPINDGMNEVVGMFSDCTSLTSAPALPATTLAESCYEYMFFGCTSLTEAPVLPATTLADYCYSRMFRGCTKLNKVTMLATDISASNCLNYWLDGVSSTGTFIKSSEMDESSFEKGSSGIPSGWTVENYIE